mmetsp:Transcript_42122/g.65915  ORF Transcript_42122/g.65915 Transcript_42122/m.65915 type:complete len:138 (-) Transcript_42122:2298-2711(-)
MTSFLEGGCQCGAVRYKVAAEASSTNHCHCTMCRKTHGAMFATFAIIDRSKFSITKGEDGLKVYESTPGNTRTFCSTCGCPLMWQGSKEPNNVYYTAGTLDDGANPGHSAENIQHIWIQSKVPWFEVGDSLPKLQQE